MPTLKSTYACHPRDPIFWAITSGIIAAYLWILWSSGILARGFHYSEIQLVVYSLERANGISFLESARYWLGETLQHRFTPLYVLHQIFMARVYGEHFERIMLHMAGLGAFSLGFLMLFSRALGWKAWAGALMGLIFAIGPQTEVWWVTDGTEPLWLLFMTLALWMAAESARHQGLAKRSVDALFLVAVLLMSLCKETMVLMIPALLAVKVWVESCITGGTVTKTFQQYWLPGTLVLGTMAAELFYIAKVIGLKGTGYAGVDHLQIAQVIQAAGIMGVKGLGYPLIGVLVLLVLIRGTMLLRRSGGERQAAMVNPKDALVMLVVASLIVAPAALVYSRGVLDRFIFPANIGFLLILFYLFYTVRANLAGFAKLLVTAVFVAVCLGTVGSRVGGVHAAAQGFMAAGDLATRTLSATNVIGQKDKPVVVVAEPVRHCEISCSFKTYLQKKLGFGQVYLDPILLPRYDAFGRDLVKYVVRHYDGKVWTGREGVRLSPGTVIFMPGAYAAFQKNPPEWFAAAEWKKKERIGPYVVLGA
jgi:hypothetical protein